MPGFARHERLRRPAEFKRVYEQGARIPGRYLTLFLLPNALAVGRLGITASRKLGNAVSRNRAKRLIREVFRRNKVAPGFDIVIVPKQGLLDASLTAIEAEYCRNIQPRLRQMGRSG